MPSFRGAGHRSDGVDQTTATGRAYVRLKADVLTCRFAPGSMLYEGDLAEELGVSKTPVREALGMLVHEGLVQVRPRRGYVVTPVTLADVKEIYHLRTLLEPAAAELAAHNASPDQLARLRQLAEGSDEHDYAGRVRHASRFHVVLADASGSARLADALVGAVEECQRLFFLDLDLTDLADHTGHDHAEVVAALEAGDAAAARAVVSRQVAAARDLVLSRIAHRLTAPDPATQDRDLVIGP